MTLQKWTIGKVFLSHSSIDKPFVRRLAGRIRKAGFDVWLDELEVLPGDSIPARLAYALVSCRVVIVVISEASLKSKWLSYELNMAIERMVKGLCRVIPVLKDSVEPPPEIKGIAYADFRKSTQSGFKALVSALELEAVAARRHQGFWAQVDEILEEVFEFTGSQALGREYSTRDLEFVGLNARADDEDDTCVVYETISAYSEPARPLGEQWWKEYHDAMYQVPDFEYFLVVSERPVAFESGERHGRVTVCLHTWEWEGTKTIGPVYVIVDLAGVDSREERVLIIREARARIEYFVNLKRPSA